MAYQNEHLLTNVCDIVTGGRDAALAIMSRHIISRKQRTVHVPHRCYLQALFPSFFSSFLPSKPLFTTSSLH